MVITGLMGAKFERLMLGEHFAPVLDLPRLRLVCPCAAQPITGVKSHPWDKVLWLYNCHVRPYANRAFAVCAWGLWAQKVEGRGHSTRHESCRPCVCMLCKPLCTQRPLTAGLPACLH